MFIKKYVKDNKTYFMLVVVEQTREDIPHFINCFINEQLAYALSRLGVEIKQKGKK